MLASIPVSDILDCATMLYVTTSWDDGDTLDRKLGRLLSRYGVKGTFYVAKEYRKERLSEEEIRVLSKAHEVGDLGDTLDRKLGRLLSRYGVKGTFYVAKEYRKERLSEEEIRVLSKAHEVG